MSTPIELLYQFDQFLTNKLSQYSFTSNLLITPTSKFITEVLIISFFLLLSYEIVYWSGIYLNLWEYHAKDVFTEIPIHCAHLYIRLNIINSNIIDKLIDYYSIKQKSKFNPYYWNQLNSLGNDIFKLDKFLKYYFEFSPEDFEMNKQPEYGSTIEHLRNKTLKLFIESSELSKKYENENEKLTIDNVLIFNNKNEIVPSSKNDEYLSKCNIETGNVIDIVMVI
ncbi:unnamed protein product [Candida verbasci]|uniref:Uncharacterized protein n=1 Tax=Candida verbasci TaxID=1227364 RepID=A0A9W4XMB6_9ASCO|nr:unnamed protein product [Candida verbasci]